MQALQTQDFDSSHCSIDSHEILPFCLCLRLATAPSTAMVYEFYVGNTHENIEIHRPNCCRWSKLLTGVSLLQP